MYLPVGTFRNELFYVTSPWRRIQHEGTRKRYFCKRGVRPEWNSKKQRISVNHEQSRPCWPWVLSKQCKGYHAALQYYWGYQQIQRDGTKSQTMMIHLSIVQYRNPTCPNLLDNPMKMRIPGKRILGASRVEIQRWKTLAAARPPIPGRTTKRSSWPEA